MNRCCNLDFQRFNSYLVNKFFDLSALTIQDTRYYFNEMIYDGSVTAMVFIDFLSNGEMFG